MEKIDFKIYLMTDRHGNKAFAVCGDTSEDVLVFGLRGADNESLQFESAAYRLSAWCYANKISLRVVDRSENFMALWDAPQNFSVGDQVVYIPNHANGDRWHPDCQLGIVSTVNGEGPEQKVWVLYAIGETGASTPVHNLLKR